MKFLPMPTTPPRQTQLEHALHNLLTAAETALNARQGHGRTLALQRLRDEATRAHKALQQ